MKKFLKEEFVILEVGDVDTVVVAIPVVVGKGVEPD